MYQVSKDQHFVSQLPPAVRRALEITELQRSLRLARKASPPGRPMQQLLGDSPALQETWDRLVRVAPLPQVTVLLLGETGTGKSRVARVLHELSPRAAQPLVPVNCAALPSSLVTG